MARIGTFDLYTTLQNGFCYNRFNLFGAGELVNLDKPILPVGKYTGDFLFVVEAAGHAGDLLQLLVKTDGIALQGSHICIAIERMKTTSGMPSGARGKLRALNKHDIGPAEFGKMIEDRGTDNTTPDDHNL